MKKQCFENKTKFSECSDTFYSANFSNAWLNPISVPVFHLLQHPISVASEKHLTDSWENESKVEDDLLV